MPDTPLAAPLTPEQLSELPSPKLAPYLERANAGDFTPNQRLLAALLARSHDAYFVSELGTAWLGVAAGVTIASGVLLFVFWLAHYTRLDLVLYALAGALMIFLYAVTKIARGRKIHLKRDRDGKIETLWLGLLSEVINPGTLMGITFFLATGMVTQTALIRFTSNHLDIPTGGSLLDAMLVTLKSVWHIPLDVVEPYIGAIGGPKPQGPSFWSGAVLSFFRVVYDGLLGIAIYCTWERWQVRKLYARHPRSGSVGELLDWMEEVSRDKANWGRKLHDEITFNMIADEYLRGNFDLVRELARQFVCIDVANEVRRLFVDPRDGGLLFEMREETEGSKSAK